MKRFKKTIRCKASCGITASWTIRERSDGKFKIDSLGSAKSGGNPIPLAFVPFEMSNAVYRSPIFDTANAAEDFVRSI